jgi:endonuclease YncB( thermonuclease family)
MPKLFRLIFAMPLLLFLIACENLSTTLPTTAQPTTEAPTSLITTAASTTIEAPTTVQLTTSNQITLPDLEGKSRSEITEILEGLGLTVKYYFDISSVFDSEDDYDKFIRFGSNLKSGDPVELGTEVRVYTSPLSIEAKYIYDLDEYKDSLGKPLQLVEADYNGKDFIADGIGVVTTDRYIDGDTTWFNVGRQSISVRYLGIDTPESTALYEPWGKAAARYTENKLRNAETIVLQAEGERTDNNGRYLAWVWYRNSANSDFVLLNLELVELAYSKNKVASGSRFNEVLSRANGDAMQTKRRVWGEIDPEYDYSKEGSQMTIRYLVENFEEYVGLKVTVTGTISRKVGSHVYLQDDDGYGVYIYTGFTSSAQLVVGANLTFGGMVPTYYSGSPQLTNFSTKQLFVNAPGSLVVPRVITYNDLAFSKIGSLVKFENLTVTSLYTGASGATIKVRDGNNNTITIRIDDSTLITLEALGLKVGDAIDVIGPLSYYDYDYDGTNPNYVYDKSKYQVMLADQQDITKINGD